MTQRYRDVLDYEIGARIFVGFETRGRNVMDYAVVLTVDEDDGSVAMVRVHDGAHGSNEMHRMIAVAERRQGRPFMPVLLEKECEVVGEWAVLSRDAMLASGGVVDQAAIPLGMLVGTTGSKQAGHAAPETMSGARRLS